MGENDKPTINLSKFQDDSGRELRSAEVFGGEGQAADRAPQPQEGGQAAEEGAAGGSSKTLTSCFVKAFLVVPLRDGHSVINTFLRAVGAA